MLQTVARLNACSQLVKLLDASILYPLVIYTLSNTFNIEKIMITLLQRVPKQIEYCIPMYMDELLVTPYVWNIGLP